MDLLTVRNRVSGYLISASSVTTALIDAWINLGIRAAEERYNFRHMEQTLEATTTVATRKLADKPALWKESRGYPWYLRDDGSNPRILFAPSEDEMLAQFDSGDTDDEGAPQFVLETESELDVYPFPDGESDWTGGEYRVRVPYWGYSADLSADADDETVSPILALAPFYPVFYAVAEALLHERDEQRAGLYQGKAEIEFRRAVNRSKRSAIPDRLSLVPRSGVYGRAITRRRGRRFGRWS